jgi:hypothetical protein
MKYRFPLDSGTGTDTMSTPSTTNAGAGPFLRSNLTTDSAKANFAKPSLSSLVISPYFTKGEAHPLIAVAIIKHLIFRMLFI